MFFDQSVNTVQRGGGVFLTKEIGQIIYPHANIRSWMLTLHHIEKLTAVNERPEHKN